MEKQFAEDTKKSFPLLLFLSLLLLFIAVESLLFYSPEKEGGELYAAAIALRDALEENETVATFLGLTAKETDREIVEKADEYIKEHGGKKSFRIMMFPWEK